MFLVQLFRKLTRDVRTYVQKVLRHIFVVTTDLISERFPAVQCQAFYL